LQVKPAPYFAEFNQIRFSTQAAGRKCYLEVAGLLMSEYLNHRVLDCSKNI